MREVHLLIHENKLELSPYNAKLLKQWVKDAGRPLRATISVLTPESRNQRKFYHGALIPLFCYLNDLDYKDSEVLEKAHILLATEFNGDIIVVKGKEHRVPKSTKGKLNDGYIDRIIDHLVEQYGIDQTKVLDVELYKKWRYTIFPYTTIDNFVDYLRKIGNLK